MAAAFTLEAARLGLPFVVAAAHAHRGVSQRMLKTLNFEPYGDVEGAGRGFVHFIRNLDAS